jgi:hypothetical protein
VPLTPRSCTSVLADLVVPRHARTHARASTTLRSLSLHDSTYRHCIWLVDDVRSGGMSTDSAPAPCGSAQRPSRRTEHLLETCLHQCTRTAPRSRHTCAHRNCATHLAEWCPPCYYAGGPLPSSVEPRGACVTVRDLWTFRPGTRHTVRSASALTRHSQCCDFVTNRI